MSKPESTVNVELLGKEYLVACPPENRLDLERAAQLLNARMKDIKDQGKLYGTERVAIMAALNLAYDYLNATCASDSTQSQIKQMNNKIEGALAQDQQLDLGE
ncbi:MAG: cell division protein ZapA [Gammaproteobacteria bacterium]|nr:cell division protein ZapA [Gammaproteobacteria bacterium]